MNNAFTKTLRIGLSKDGDVFVRVEYKGDGELSLTGVIGPMGNGNARGSCGQINSFPWEITQYAPGWSADSEAKLRQVWNDWHLNGMRAGSPNQESYLKLNPVHAVYPESHYDKASEALKAAGMNPDLDYIHNGKPYKYGSAWLSSVVPGDVLRWLKSLPDTDKTPAWV